MDRAKFLGVISCTVGVSGGQSEPLSGSLQLQAPGQPHLPVSLPRQLPLCGGSALTLSSASLRKGVSSSVFPDTTEM